MKRPDGSLCSTSEENAAVFYQHFQQLYNRSVILDLTVLDFSKMILFKVMTTYPLIMELNGNIKIKEHCPQ